MISHLIVLLWVEVKTNTLPHNVDYNNGPSVASYIRLAIKLLF